MTTTLRLAVLVGLLLELEVSVSLQARCQSLALAQVTQRNLEMSGAIDRWPEQVKRYALIIGVDEYQDSQVSKLVGASNDAKALSETLTRYAGFPSNQVTLMTPDQPLERRPTRGNILRRLSNLRSAAAKDGLLLVAFSGHGTQLDGRAYLLPMDAQVSRDVSLLEDTAINVEVMRDRIRQTGVGQVIIILDACRNNPMAGRGDAGNPMTGTFERGFNFDVRNKEVTAFATLYATSDGKVAYENKEKKLGYFTWALVEGLKGAAANESNEVTLTNLIKYLDDTVPRQVLYDLGPGNEQRPFAATEGYRASELVLAVGPSRSAGTPAVSGTMSSKSNADLHAKRGEKLENEGKWAEAEAEYRRAVSIEPNNALRHFSLAQILEKQKKWLDTVVAYKEAIRIEPKTATFYGSLGSLFGEQQKWSEAESQFRAAITLDAKNYLWHVGLANALYGQRRFGEAESEYKLVVQSEKNVAVLHRNLSLILAIQKKWTEAEAEASEAVRLAPTNDEYQDTLRQIHNREYGSTADASENAKSTGSASQHGEAGDILGKQKKWEAAELEYRQAVQIEPNRAQWRNALATALFNLQKWAEADSQLREAVRLEPNNAQWHASLGLLLFRAGRWPDGEKEYREAIRLEPDKARWYAGAGGALMEQKKYSKAEAEFQEAVRLEPSTARWHFNLGRAFFSQQKWDKAESCFRQAVRLDSKHADWYNFLGNTLYSRQQWKESIDEYRQAVRIDPNASWAHNNLAFALRKLRRWPEAEAEAREAVRLDPTNSKYKENLRRVLNKDSQ